MFDSIPQSRLLLYLLLAGAVVPLILLFYSHSRIAEIDSLAMYLEQVQAQAQLKESRQFVNQAVIEHFKDADKFYIDKHLENLTFLENEIEATQKIVQDENFPVEPATKKRLEVLTSPANRLAFSEGVVQRYPQYQEVTETLVRPVEVNAEDIKKILSRIEGTRIGPFAPGLNRPQLIILEFRLDKKILSDKNEDYLLNLKLLKREYQ